jgi:hypothetical protein
MSLSSHIRASQEEFVSRLEVQRTVHQGYADRGGGRTLVRRAREQGIAEGLAIAIRAVQAWDNAPRDEAGWTEGDIRAAYTAGRNGAGPDYFERSMRLRRDYPDEFCIEHDGSGDEQAWRWARRHDLHGGPHDEPPKNRDLRALSRRTSDHTRDG